MAQYVKSRGWLEEIERYKLLVGEFAALTDMKFYTGRCCRTTDADGRPECCAQVVAGADLTFTTAEVGILTSPEMGNDQIDYHWFKKKDHQEFGLNREFVTSEMLSKSLHTGPLSRTLESASHPLRPVIGLGHAVIGVVCINGCNRDVAIGRYFSERELLKAMWQEAVDTYGMKSYYCSWELKNDWTVI